MGETETRRGGSRDDAFHCTAQFDDDGRDRSGSPFIKGHQRARNRARTRMHRSPRPGAVWASSPWSWDSPMPLRKMVVNGTSAGRSPRSTAPALCSSPRRPAPAAGPSGGQAPHRSPSAHRSRYLLSAGPWWLMRTKKDDVLATGHTPTATATVLPAARTRDGHLIRASPRFQRPSPAGPAPPRRVTTAAVCRSGHSTAKQQQTGTVSPGGSARRASGAARITVPGRVAMDTNAAAPAPPAASGIRHRHQGGTCTFWLSWPRSMLTLVGIWCERWQGQLLGRRHAQERKEPLLSEKRWKGLLFDHDDLCGMVNALGGVGKFMCLY